MTLRFSQFACLALAINLSSVWPAHAELRQPFAISPVAHSELEPTHDTALPSSSPLQQPFEISPVSETLLQENPAGEAAPDCAADCDCEEACGCGPLWTFKFGALFLERDNPPDQTFLVDSSINEVVNANEFDYGLGTGWEIEANRQLHCGWSIEGRYARVDSWSGSLGPVVGAGGIGVLAAAGGTFGIFGADSEAVVNFRSELESAELMLRKEWSDRIDFTLGARYLRFDDGQVSAVIRDLIGFNVDNQFDVSAFNSMIGVQAGADFRLWEGCQADLLLLTKGGVYKNNTSNRIEGFSNFFGIDLESGIADDRTSFSGEIELRGRYRLNDCWSLEGGYRFLYLDRIALATEQAIANPTPDDGPATVLDSDDNLLIHGATAFLTFEY